MPSQAESFQVGGVSLSQRWFGDGRITEGAFRDAQVAAGAELEEALAQFAPHLWQEALGSSGTVGAVSHVLMAAGRSDGAITAQGLLWCMQGCLQAGHVDQLQLPSLRDDRRAILPGGLALLFTLVDHFGIERLLPAKGALRQGVIIDLDARLQAGRQPGEGDLRDHTVSSLLQRFGAVLAHAAQVSQVALALHDSVLPQAEPELRRELAWACALHELGLMVSHHDHHRHSAYLIAHVDAPGFSQSQQPRMAALVPAQRGGLRKVESQLASDSFAWQALALRLAVIECHARSASTSGIIGLRRDGRQACLHAPPAWAQAQPRTAHLLHEETAQWERQPALSLQADF